MFNLSKLLVFAVAITLLSACSSQLKYVIYRDIPEHPAFTVLPVSHTYADYQFRSEVESSLLELGLSVVEAPIKIHTVAKPESRALRAKSEGKLSTASQSLAVNDLVMNSVVYDQSKADYVIMVDASTDILKIVRRSSSEIQAVIEYTVLDKAGSRFVKLHDVLKNLGFKIKTVSKKEKLKMEYPLKEKSLMRY